MTPRVAVFKRHRHRAPHRGSGASHIGPAALGRCSFVPVLFPLSPYLPSALRPLHSYQKIKIKSSLFSKIFTKHRTFLLRRNVLPSPATPIWLTAIQPRPAAATWRQRGGNAAPPKGSPDMRYHAPPRATTRYHAPPRGTTRHHAAGSPDIRTTPRHPRPLRVSA